TYRDLELWVDQPPPQKDPGLGIGKYIAWQTPLHREAVRKALQEASTA
ncbi:MAG: AAA family ATPase, partial [Desulfurococcaceae archaeon]|nr:AAA family ATPase [Desulfurococcaceae archaeon]